MPIWRYSSWCVSGSSTASRISCFWMSSPPMSCTRQAQAVRHPARYQTQGSERERSPQQRAKCSSNTPISCLRARLCHRINELYLTFKPVATKYFNPITTLVLNTSVNVRNIFCTLALLECFQITALGSAPCNPCRCHGFHQIRGAVRQRWPQLMRDLLSRHVGT